MILKLMKFNLSFLVFLFFAQPLFCAQSLLSADGITNTYKLIEMAFGSGAYEVPDCAHPAFGPHITQAWDTDLGKYVFVFHLHVAQDNDRCEKFDRQRCEIKTYEPSADFLKGFQGDVCTYRWKFKLDANFQPSRSFCHIHQIKAVGGDDGMPLITLTPRAGWPEKFQVIYIPPTGQGNQTLLTDADLSVFKGVWVEAEEKIRYGDKGSYDLVIRRLKDGAVLLSYNNQNLDLWRDGASFIRPKWGIYRSLKTHDSLRDEDVRFDDFCVGKGDAVCGEAETQNPTVTTIK
jgi:hypothetical protein